MSSWKVCVMEKLTLRDRLIFAVGILGIAAVAGLPSADAADASKGKRVMYAQQNASHPYIAASFKAFRERAEQVRDGNYRAGRRVRRCTAKPTSR